MTNRKNDVKFHEVLKQASISVYSKKPLPTGYKVIDKAENKENGFYAEAISNGKNVIVAYRGTNDGLDFVNDVAMAHSDIPSQATDALAFHDKIVGKYGADNVTITGHSLGGSNAEIVSGIHGTTAVTFNAYGVKDMFKSGTKLDNSNIVNYVNEKDAITMVNGQNHLGEIYSVPNVGKGNFGCHSAEGMGNLSERVQKTPSEIQKIAKNEHQSSLTIKVGISKTVEARNLYRNYRKLEQEKIQKRHQEFKHAKGNNYSECVGSYSVSGYTRSDGKEVNGYTRTCGAKHNN